MSKIEESYNKECGYCIDNKCNFNINDITKCNWHKPQLIQNKNNAKKVEECWVIQRDDGKFYVRTRKCGHRTRHLYDDRLQYAHFENCKSDTEETIKVYNLQNCKPVKVEIRVVGE